MEQYHKEDPFRRYLIVGVMSAVGVLFMYPPILICISLITAVTWLGAILYAGRMVSPLLWALGCYASAYALGVAALLLGMIVWGNRFSPRSHYHAQRI